MSEVDAETLGQQVTLLGLVTREQLKEARFHAEDGSVEALERVLLRQELVTSWQLEKLRKGDVEGFFYGGCRVLFHLAEGSFARVYRGAKLPGNQPVAIKVLRQRFVADPSAVDRFNQEAEAGIKLIHNNIVRTYEYGEQDKRYFMIMEYVEGANLRDFLKIRGVLKPTDALPLMIGLAHGLRYSHAQGVTHRDIKPTNILISNHGAAKLVDFGLANLREGSSEDKKLAAAHGQRTVDYSALERTCGSPKGDPRSDIFFMGCVYYQMLCGMLPLPEVEAKDPLKKMLVRSFSAIKPLSDQRNAPDEELCRIVEKMMKIDLKQRYQSMDEVVRDLEAFIAGLVVSPQPSSPGRKAAPTPTEVEDLEFSEDDLLPHEVEAGPAEDRKSLLCVEFQPDIQDAFRKSLTKLGYRVLLVGDAERSVERFRELRPDAVVFDVDGLGPESLDSFLEMHEAAREEGHDLRALVLLGPRQHYLASRLPESERLIVLTKPIKMRQVQDAVLRLAPRQVAGS